MAEVEVGFGAVIGHVDFAVLIRAHRAGIDVEIGVELAQADLEAARLQQRAERRRSETLAERGDHAAGDEDITAPWVASFYLANDSGEPGFQPALS